MVAAAISAAAAVGSAVISSKASKSAANKAADAQTQSAQAGIDQQNAQFQQIQKLLSPYVQAGNGALGAQQNLLGLSGNDAQASAIAGLQNSAQFKALQQQGNDAILANASATGGLRGGNVQGALGQFNQSLLAQQIQQQYANLGGLTSLGQNAAAGVGNAGMANANNVSALLQQQGAAAAGSALAGGAAQASLYNSIGNGIGLYAGLGGFGGGMSPGYGAMNASGQF